MYIIDLTLLSCCSFLSELVARKEEVCVICWRSTHKRFFTVEEVSDVLSVPKSLLSLLLCTLRTPFRRIGYFDRVRCLSHAGTDYVETMSVWLLRKLLNKIEITHTQKSWSWKSWKLSLDSRSLERTRNNSSILCRQYMTWWLIVFGQHDYLSLL